MLAGPPTRLCELRSQQYLEYLSTKESGEAIALLDALSPSLTHTHTFMVGPG